MKVHPTVCDEIGHKVSEEAHPAGNELSSLESVTQRCYPLTLVVLRRERHLSLSHISRILIQYHLLGNMIFLGVSSVCQRLPQLHWFGYRNKVTTSSEGKGRSLALFLQKTKSNGKRFYKRVTRALSRGSLGA